MPTQDPRVDAYIAKSAAFAKPILIHLRKLIHTACPQVEETMKWSVPAYQHKGILCMTPAFKQHCRLVFWKGALLFGKGKSGESAAEHFGRITCLADLPVNKVLLGHLKEAVRLNESGAKLAVRAKPKAPKKLVIPGYLLAALRKNKKARATFENFSHTNRKEYVEWLTEAKGEDTRRRRLATALEWLAEGKSRNWKYQNC
jgi:hypothetical protein